MIATAEGTQIKALFKEALVELIQRCIFVLSAPLQRT